MTPGAHPEVTPTQNQPPQCKLFSLASAARQIDPEALLEIRVSGEGN